jgi:Fe-S oxidoreductase
MSIVFAPGCALILHRPDLASRIHKALEDELGSLPMLETCCRKPPDAGAGTQVVNVCPGCDRRYRELYAGVATISAWEVLAKSETLSVPDYGGIEMAVHDACPTRTETRVHDAVRALLARMNIVVVEPRHSRSHAVCCCDSFFGLVPRDKIVAQMRRRAEAMPRADVVVYCVSCIKSMYLGGRQPRHLVDLLFGESTTPGTLDPVEWHAELDAFIASH